MNILSPIRDVPQLPCQAMQEEANMGIRILAQELVKSPKVMHCRAIYKHKIKAL